MANCLFDFNQKEEKKEYAYSCVRLGMATQKKMFRKSEKLSNSDQQKPTNYYLKQSLIDKLIF